MPDVVIKTTGHDYYAQDDKCSKCGTTIPTVKLGDTTTHNYKVAGDASAINGYNILKFVAPADGTLEVTAEYAYSIETCGSVWNGSKSERLAFAQDSKSLNLACSVTKGETYYIGTRRDDGTAIDGDLTLSVKLNGLDYVVAEGVNGDGTAEAPFELMTAEHLKWFAQHVNGTGEYSPVTHPTACAKLMNDISLSSVCHAADGGVEKQNWEPISTEDVKWSGTFEGNGKTISDLYIDIYTLQNNIGLFGYIGAATIKDLTFKKAYVSNATLGNSHNDNAGILVGFADGATIQNIKTDETSHISGDRYVGGIVGYLNGLIQDCENNAYVASMQYYTGGICGYLDGSSSVIKRCVNYSPNENMVTSGNGTEVGGIVGHIENGTVEDCANHGTVRGFNQIGGISGYITEGTLKNVFADGRLEPQSVNRSYGLMAGYIPSNGKANAVGLLAYNSETAIVAFDNTAGGTAETGEVRALGLGSFKSGSDCVAAFTTDQFKTGEVTYKLNGGVTDGTQTWYQKLGDGGDAYPVMAAAEGNTVYKAVGYTCDEQLIPETTPVYANTEIYHTPHHFDKERQETSGVYAIVCSSCGTYKDDKRTIKDFAGEGNNLEVTEAEDGTYSVAELTLNDGTPYYSPVTLTVGSLSYDRSFAGNAGKWQALYVPFALDCSEISDSYEVAAINNFHEYEQKDGTTKVVLEVKMLTSGTIDALTPCVIRLKEGGDATQPVLKNGSMESELVSSRGDNADRYIDCSSVTRYYRFTGLLQPKQGFSADNDFALLDGKLFKANADATLKAQRWYLTATNRSAAASAMALRSIAIDVIGEGEATGIADLYVTTDSDNTPSSLHGIYDLQGRKLDREPASGVYIKDGRKYVK